MEKKTYLLTGGIVPLLENRHKVVLADECKKRIEEIEQNYVRMFSSHLNGYVDESKGFTWDVRFIPATDIENYLREIVGSNRSGRPLISLDDVYCTDLPDAFYSITRAMDPNDLQKGATLGPRYGYPSLEEQAKKIAKDFGKKIDIMDIGTFEGETITGEIKGRFMQEGIKVDRVYLAFAGETGIRNLKVNGINPIFKELMNWVDWLEVRDCVGFDGRKVIRSCFDDHVANAFIKYTYNPECWGSIPSSHRGEFEKMYNVSFDRIKNCLKESNYEISLIPSKENPIVNGLRIERK